ncbi:MAG: hypothetical protein WC010_01730 [Candidatus Absconditabacterales bacterium]
MKHIPKIIAMVLFVSNIYAQDTLQNQQEKSQLYKELVQFIGYSKINNTEIVNIEPTNTLDTNINYKKKPFNKIILSFVESIEKNFYFKLSKDTNEPLILKLAYQSSNSLLYVVHIEKTSDNFKEIAIYNITKDRFNKPDNDDDLDIIARIRVNISNVNRLYEDHQFAWEEDIVQNLISEMIILNNSMANF